MTKKEQPKSGTADWLRTFKGFENHNDEAALKTMESIDKLARILLPIVIEDLKVQQEEERRSKK
ncbi:MAG: hypothetical protein DI538_27215 [Azospira oryzae]|nr:MAG: hypothetical protein DI538_27215 [Azospira oryzae]